MRVRAFRNLNSGCISLQAMAGPFKGKVIAHVHNAFLTSCKMVVHEKARQEVIRVQRKSVHAWIEGDLVAADLIRLRYELDAFPHQDTGMKSPQIKQTKTTKNPTKVDAAAPGCYPAFHACFGVAHDTHVRYNPYLRGEFFVQGEGDPVWSCPSAVVKNDGVWAQCVSSDLKADWINHLEQAKRNTNECATALQSKHTVPRPVSSQENLQLELA